VWGLIKFVHNILGSKATARAGTARRPDCTQWRNWTSGYEEGQVGLSLSLEDGVKVNFLEVVIKNKGSSPRTTQGEVVTKRGVMEGG